MYTPCTRCGSYALNDARGTGLCDKCWRDARIAELEAERDELRAGGGLLLTANENDFWAGKEVMEYVLGKRVDLDSDKVCEAWDDIVRERDEWLARAERAEAAIKAHCENTECHGECFNSNCALKDFPA